MRIKQKLYIIVAFLIGGLFSCSEESIPADPAQVQKGMEYFPTQVGTYVEYQVRRINHQELVANDTSDFYIRQVIASVDDSGSTPIYRLERFRKNTLAESWKLDSVWTARIEERRLVQVENNQPFVKLVFPASLPLSWDGNSYNGMPEEDYELSSIDVSYSLNGESFPLTATVTHNDAYTLIDQDTRVEVYAANIGLIHRKKEVYSFINDSQSPFYAQDSIVGGEFYEEVMIDYGVEYSMD